MARRVATDEAPEATAPVEPETPNTPDSPDEPETPEAPNETEGDGGESTESPASENAEASDEIDLSEFEAAARKAVSEMDADTGVIATAKVEPVVIVYRNLPGGIKAKNRAKTLVGEGIREGMKQNSIQLARAWMQLQDALTSTTKAPAEKVPANPTEAAVTLDAALQLARRLVAVNVGEGVAEDWQDQANKLASDNEVPSDDYLDWFKSDEKGDEPETSDVVKMAVKLYRGRAAKLAKRTGSVRAPFEGTRRNIGEHITQAFKGVEPGTFLTVAQIRAKHSTEYGDDLPSPGAISARLFPPSGKCTVEGITPGTNEKGNKGATKD